MKNPSHIDHKYIHLIHHVMFLYRYNVYNTIIYIVTIFIMLKYILELIKKYFSKNESIKIIISVTLFKIFFFLFFLNKLPNNYLDK